jgi:WD40 repeat protein
VIDVLDWPGGTGPTWRPEVTATHPDSQRVHALAFSPDGKLLASANGMSGFVEDTSEEWFGWGGSLLLFDVAKGECIAQFPREKDDILAVAFSPDGSLLFSGATDCQIRVVDVASRQEIAVLCGHIGCVNHLAFSPDGETLASAGGDGLVRLWPWRQILDRPVPKAKKKR